MSNAVPSDRSRSIHVLIVDDEPLARKRLSALCERTPEIGQIDTADGGQDAWDQITGNCPDLLLLDVDMPGLSGLELADRCRSEAHKLTAVPEIVFTTAHSTYAAQSYRLDAADYLLKPVKQSLLVEAVQKVEIRRNAVGAGINVQSQTESPDSYLWVQDSEGTIRIRCCDIQYVRAERDYMRLCLQDHSYLVHEPMHVMQSRLPSDIFLRIHRSAVVRKDFVKDIRRDKRRIYALLQDGTELPVGPSYISVLGKNIRTCRHDVQAGGTGLSDTVRE
ncbi:MAG: LytTR family DNA-binding domain-containing protein [Parasphingorhabdus sp.]